jgi:hypothetical protein
VQSSQKQLLQSRHGHDSLPLESHSSSQNTKKRRQPPPQQTTTTTIFNTMVSHQTTSPDDVTIVFEHNEGDKNAAKDDSKAPVTTTKQAETSHQTNKTIKSHQHNGKLDDIDARDAHDPQCATAYVQDMYEHFRLQESVHPNYMKHQPYLDKQMYASLVDWLLDVQECFFLLRETTYLAVDLLDRYLAQEEVSCSDLRLVGLAAFWIASKYEDIYPPDVDGLCFVCQGAYFPQAIIDMEEKMLKTLDYRVTVPTAHAFLVRFLKAGDANKEIADLSYSMLESTLYSCQLSNRYLPSQLAAAAVLIARQRAGRDAWSPSLLHYTKYSKEDIMPIARAILWEKALSIVGALWFCAVKKLRDGYAWGRYQCGYLWQFVIMLVSLYIW